MRVEEVREVLKAPDPTSRNALIVAHLDRVEGQLAESQAAVTSLRSLLEHPSDPISVRLRTVPSTAALAVSEKVTLADLSTWWSGAFDELDHCAASLGIERTGPDGALFDSELFEEELGDVVAFVPVGVGTMQAVTVGRLVTTGRVRTIEAPEAELALAVHCGSHAEVDRTYGALGT